MAKCCTEQTGYCRFTETRLNSAFIGNYFQLQIDFEGTAVFLQQDAEFGIDTGDNGASVLWNEGLYDSLMSFSLFLILLLTLELIQQRKAIRNATLQIMHLE